MNADNMIQIEPLPTHCPQCGTEYQNTQHPLKPAGVIMTSVCDCVPVVTTTGTTTIVTWTPPKKS
jgi:hypothetical protein